MCYNKKYLFSLLLFCTLLPLAAVMGNDSVLIKKAAVPGTGKELYLPAKVWRVPDNNNYDSDTSEYNHKRKVEGENIVIFWAKEFGDDPMQNENVAKRFDVHLVSTGDRSAKIRTYNYPQGRVTDHRINFTSYNLDAVMNGGIQDFLDALQFAENAEKLTKAE